MPGHLELYHHQRGLVAACYILLAHHIGRALHNRNFAVEPARVHWDNEEAWVNVMARAAAFATVALVYGTAVDEVVLQKQVGWQAPLTGLESVVAVAGSMPNRP